MTSAEITAYNYGKRLAAASLEAVNDGRGSIMPDACILTPEETASLERLGREAWWAQVQKGGNEVFGARDAVRPVQEAT